jgi:hypothetical protein
MVTISVATEVPNVCVSDRRRCWLDPDPNNWICITRVAFVEQTL